MCAELQSQMKHYEYSVECKQLEASSTHYRAATPLVGLGALLEAEREWNGEMNFGCNSYITPFTRHRGIVWACRGAVGAGRPQRS